MHLDVKTPPEPERYLHYIRQKEIFIAGSTIFLIILFFMAIAVGSSFIPLADVASAFFFSSYGNASTIVMNIRLPRVLAAVIGGAGLAAAGVVMQSVLRNPLSSPYTLGISHAAAFGAAFAITALGAGSLSHLISDSVVVRNPYAVTICAFLGAMIATAGLLLVARFRSSQPEVMILVGVALAALFTAGTTFLQYFSSADQIAAIVFWTFGDVGRATWSDLTLIAAIVTGEGLHAYTWHQLVLTLYGTQQTRLFQRCPIVGDVTCPGAEAWVFRIFPIGALNPVCCVRKSWNNLSFRVPSCASTGMVEMQVRKHYVRHALARHAKVIQTQEKIILAFQSHTVPEQFAFLVTIAAVHQNHASITTDQQHVARHADAVQFVRFHDSGPHHFGHRSKYGTTIQTEGPSLDDLNVPFPQVHQYPFLSTIGCRSCRCR